MKTKFNDLEIEGNPKEMAELLNTIYNKRKESIVIRPNVIRPNIFNFKNKILSKKHIPELTKEIILYSNEHGYFETMNKYNIKYSALSQLRHNNPGIAISLNRFKTKP